jgi:nucleoside 2-deoxyribosyltransferase
MEEVEELTAGPEGTEGQRPCPRVGREGGGIVREKTEDKVAVYLAGPLFSRAEVEWAGSLKREMEAALGERIEVIWPFEVASGSKGEIFRANLAALSRSPLMVAVLDGPAVDDGTAWEVGCHFALFGRRAIGIRTDVRKAGEAPDSRVNLMIEEACRAVVGEVGVLLRELAAALEEVSPPELNAIGPKAPEPAE